MMRERYWAIWVVICLLGAACQASLPETSQAEEFSEESQAGSPYPLEEIPPAGLIGPGELQYLGFFRLPEPSGGSDWTYSGQGLTYYPAGDPDGSGDGYPGSLYGFGHDQQLLVSEIGIPAPVLTKNLAEANTAKTLQHFADLSGGIFNPIEMTLPRAGLAYLAEPQPGLHFAFGQHIQDFEPSHGWGGLDLSHPEARGAWIFDGYSNYVTNDYLFEIPPLWGEAIGPGVRLASGRAREGLWSGRGPALFAYAPGDPSTPLAPGKRLTEIYPLLLYGEQVAGLPELLSTPDQAVQGYREADHWWGGSWLTVENSAAVVFAGTKAGGDEWYGFSNGVVWEHDCAEQSPPSCPAVPPWPYDDRGFWAEDYQAQILFYDPADLVKVARGSMASWEPQPYAVLNLDPYLLDPTLDPTIYKRDLVGAMAFDRQRGILYLVERLVDDGRSVIHVWQVGG